MPPKTKFPAQSIRSLQQYIKQRIKRRGFADEDLSERLLLLTEEVGEIIKASRHLSHMNVAAANQNNIGAELVDALDYLFGIAIYLDIDLEAEFIAKEKIIDQRKYQRA
ncbi:MAG: nucleotide pyrophosphohydrolase [Patescibacteria group bacterium]